MKKIFAVSLLLSLFLGACLKKDTLDVEAFSDNNITDVVGVWYRYIVKEGDRDILKKVELNGIVKTIDNASKTITIKVTPSQSVLNSIPQEQRAQLTLSNVGVVVAVSTAARISPVDNAPLLGVNGDWSKPNKYSVMAANGDKAVWTISVTELNK